MHHIHATTRNAHNWTSFNDSGDRVWQRHRTTVSCYFEINLFDTFDRVDKHAGSIDFTLRAHCCVALTTFSHAPYKWDVLILTTDALHALIQTHSQIYRIFIIHSGRLCVEHSDNTHNSCDALCEEMCFFSQTPSGNKYRCLFGEFLMRIKNNSFCLFLLFALTKWLHSAHKYKRVTWNGQCALCLPTRYTHIHRNENNLTLLHTQQNIVRTLVCQH